MQRLLDTKVPISEAGLVSYDSYWSDIRIDALLRSIPNVREVIDKIAVAENRIKQAFTRKAYTPMVAPCSRDPIAFSSIRHTVMHNEPSKWGRKHGWFKKNGYIDQLFASEDKPDDNISIVDMAQTARRRIALNHRGMS